MIKLDVADYCHNCKRFEPDVSKFVSELIIDPSDMPPWGFDYEKCDTQIRCKDRDRCAAMYEYMERQMKNNDKT